MELNTDTPNENCLEGLQCPKCGSNGPFHIYARALFLVSDDGTDEYEQVEWDDGSGASCAGPECEWSGLVAELTEKEPT